MPEPERSIEELVEEALPCRYAGIRKMVAETGSTNPELVIAAKGCTDERPCVICRKRATLLRAVARLREYATHLPECATRDPRPADAPENQCSCGFAALTPKGGDRE